MQEAHSILDIVFPFSSESRKSKGFLLPTAIWDSSDLLQSEDNELLFVRLSQLINQTSLNLKFYFLTKPPLMASYESRRTTLWFLASHPEISRPTATYSPLPCPVWPGMVRLLRYLQTVRGARVRPHGGSSYAARAPGRMRKRGVRRTCVLCVPGPSYHALITSPAQMRRAQPPPPTHTPPHLSALPPTDIELWFYCDGSPSRRFLF